MSDKWTPGVWHAELGGSHITVGFSGHNQVGTIADLAGRPSVEINANARLIAAAPDMAAALDSALELVAKVVAGEITADDFNTGVLASYRDEFEMALAKARGKA